MAKTDPFLVEQFVLFEVVEIRRGIERGRHGPRLVTINRTERPQFGTERVDDGLWGRQHSSSHEVNL